MREERKIDARSSGPVSDSVPNSDEAAQVQTYLRAKPGLDCMGFKKRDCVLPYGDESLPAYN
jgi:hypothetical protein